MSIVTYQMGTKVYTFQSNIQLQNISLIAVEENLHEEVKKHIISLNLKNHPKPKNITIIDDNSKKAFVKDFTEIAKLEIVEK